MEQKKEIKLHKKNGNYVWHLFNRQNNPEPPTAVLLCKVFTSFLAQTLQPRCTSEYYIIIIVVKTSGNNGVLFMLYIATCIFSFAVLVNFFDFFFCVYLVVLVSFSFSFFSFCLISQIFFLFGEGKGSIVSNFVIFVYLYFAMPEISLTFSTQKKMKRP